MKSQSRSRWGSIPQADDVCSSASCATSPSGLARERRRPRSRPSSRIRTTRSSARPSTAGSRAGIEVPYGYTASEAIGQPISLIVPEDRRDELAEVMERLRRGEAVHHLETTRVRKDGRKIDAAITISPIRDASGGIVGAATIARAVTDPTELPRRVLDT